MTTPDLAGLCERLRATWDTNPCNLPGLAPNQAVPRNPDGPEAAAAIERLVAALEPFAAMAAAGDQRPKDDAVWAGQDGKRITYGDFRRARTALEGASDDR